MPHRRGAVRRQSRRCLARRRSVRRDQIAAAATPRAVPARPGHHAGRACRVCEEVRRARGSSGRGQRPGSSRSGAHLQVARQQEGALRERVALRRDVARVPAAGLRAAVHRMPGGRRRHDLGQHGRGVPPAARLHKGPHRRPARAACDRAHVRRRDGSRRASKARRAVPGGRAPGGAHAPRNG